MSNEEIGNPFPILRKKGKERESGHLKKLFCFKCKKEITTKDYVQMKRYLRATNKILGLIVNFGEKSLNIKRIINKNN